ncbi:hypothetical protein CCACVL1_02204, partial [Corchorus capsularis]
MARFFRCQSSSVICPADRAIAISDRVSMIMYSWSLLQRS